MLPGYVPEIIILKMLSKQTANEWPDGKVLTHSIVYDLSYNLLINKSNILYFCLCLLLLTLCHTLLLLLITILSLFVWQSAISYG
jgi:hypothetical protein